MISKYMNTLFHAMNNKYNQQYFLKMWSMTLIGSEFPHNKVMADEARQRCNSSNMNS